MGERIYIIGTNKKTKRDIVVTEKEIIENALHQESIGVDPMYSFYDYKKKEPITPKGWLVWSTMKGCGVVYRRRDGKMIIVTGLQGDFVFG